MASLFLWLISLEGHDKSRESSLWLRGLWLTWPALAAGDPPFVMKSQKKSAKFSSQQSWQHYSSVQSQALFFSLSFLQGCLSFEGCATVLALIHYPVYSLEVNGPSFYFYLSTPYLQEFEPPPSHHYFIKCLKLGVNTRLFCFSRVMCRRGDGCHS